MSGVPVYHLLEHCNARNAAELARCAAIGPECAVPLRTRGWAPPSEVLFGTRVTDGTIRHHKDRLRTHSLGRGDKISCGKSIPAYRGNEDGRGHENNEDNITSSRDGYNVSHPFDEAHAHPLSIFSGDRFIEWRSLENGFCELDERVILDDIFTTQNIDTLARFFFFEAITCTADLNAYTRELRRRTVFSDIVVRHTPPNHGHGAACGCVETCRAVQRTYRRLGVKIGSLSADPIALTEKGEPLPTSDGEIFYVRPDGFGWPAAFKAKGVIRLKNGRYKILYWKFMCRWCASTGRIICDDERAGRVSPSHAAGGYAEWQRLSSVVGHGTSQVPPELAGIYAMYGEPATTERE